MVVVVVWWCGGDVGHAAGAYTVFIALSTTTPWFCMCDNTIIIIILQCIAFIGVYLHQCIVHCVLILCISCVPSHILCHTSSVDSRNACRIHHTCTHGPLTSDPLPWSSPFGATLSSYLLHYAIHPFKTFLHPAAIQAGSYDDNNGRLQGKGTLTMHIEANTHPTWQGWVRALWMYVKQRQYLCINAIVVVLMW